MYLHCTDKKFQGRCFCKIIAFCRFHTVAIYVKKIYMATNVFFNLICRVFRGVEGVEMETKPLSASPVIGMMYSGQPSL